MKFEYSILLPPTALVLLTGFVWLRLGSDRLGEMRSRRIHPQQVATSKQMGETMQNVQSADHFRNLFEVPVLFYALCAFLADHQADDAVAAGVRVGLRRAARRAHVRSSHQQQGRAALPGVRRQHDRAVRDVGDLRGQVGDVGEADLHVRSRNL